mgnify:CR=1 FL=1
MKIAVVGAGDVLAIPRHWPHFVFSVSNCVSLSVHSSTISYAIRERLLQVAHNAGLYRNGHGCACHTFAPSA